ncbi:BTAD domain-containing putative transcriptional regulator [Streptomyces sp. GSL17-111]|uniref:BTAD domain-containing putative transcriptional regulator n=1 Tax=Streptomyces sp. GSL17-111 TaxID=3121596 RepID=UPI0030F43321
MRFLLLGPLSLTEGPDTVVLPPSKPTDLLAALLLNAGSVVSVDYLLRTVWGEHQPASAKAAVQTCVLRLRRLFARHGVSGTPIEAVPGGYRISAGPETLDLVDFRERVRASAGAGSPDRELRMLGDALALWDGSLLANVRSEVVHRDEVPRLTEERLRTVERACDLLLSLERCGEALVELWGMTRAHPGHERFREQLIEALYRTGRQAEALAEYRRIKEHLLDELGVDPSPALRRLELAILRGDDLGTGQGGRAELTSAATGQRGGPPELPGGAPPDSGTGGPPQLTQDGEGLARPGPSPARNPASASGFTRVDHAPAAPLATHVLRDVPHFTGRKTETEAMAARLRNADGEPVTELICGPPGVGKTALARHVARLVRDSHPGGALLLRMARPDGTSVTTEEATEAARHALAETGDAPGRTLLLLDDVVDAEQVRPLLTCGTHGAALVTSRRPLAGLVATHGGRVHRLGVFSPEESGRLLSAALGAERVQAEPEAARALADVCGHYPLALRIAAARLSTRPALRLADCARWLAEDPWARLSLTDDPDLSVERVFGTALARLDPRLAEAFRRLAALPDDALHPEDAGRVLGGLPPPEAERTLEWLADAGLLEEGPPGPYRMHALLRAYARWADDRTRSRQKV